MRCSFKGRGDWVNRTVDNILIWCSSGDISLPVEAEHYYVRKWFFKVAGGDRYDPEHIDRIYDKFESGEIPIEAFHGPHGLAMFKAWMIRNAADKN